MWKARIEWIGQSKPYGLAPDVLKFIMIGYDAGATGAFGQAANPERKTPRHWLGHAILIPVSFSVIFIFFYFVFVVFGHCGYRLPNPGSRALIISVFLSPVLAFFWWNSDACVEHTIVKTSNSSGVNLEVRSYDCDAIAHWFDISVLASTARHRRQTVLFTYAPYRDDDPVPTIEVAGNRIVISIAAVSSVRLQLQSWNEMPIEYRIGMIEYPARPASRPLPP